MDLSRDTYELLEEIVQNLQQRFSGNYKHIDIELLENCKQLSEFYTWNELDLNKFKANLLESIENKLRSICNMSNYYENNLQEFDHKRSIYEAVAQLPLVENTDKAIRYETHLQRSIEKNLRTLRSLQGYGQMSFGFQSYNVFYKIDFLKKILDPLKKSSHNLLGGFLWEDFVVV